MDSNRIETQESEKGPFQRRFILSLSVVLVVSATLLWLVWMIVFGGFATTSNARMQREVETAREELFRGQYSQAKERSLQLLEKSGGRNALAALIVENSLFASGGIAERREAIRRAQDAYVTASSNQEKALALNRLLAYGEVATAYPDLFKEIFSSHPFSTFYVDGNDAASLTNLARFALNYSSTTPALQTVAGWLGFELIMHHDGSRTLSAKKVEKRVRAMKRLLERASAIFLSNEDSHTQLMLPTLHIQQFYTKQGQLFGALSLIHREYLADSEKAFESAIAIYANEKTAGNDFPILEASLPSIYLHRAAYVNELLGEKRRPDVLADIDKAVDLMVSHPERHEHYFVANLRFVAKNPNLYGLWLDQKRLRHLASLNPKLKKFLESLGWKF